MLVEALTFDVSIPFSPIQIKTELNAVNRDSPESGVVKCHGQIVLDDTKFFLCLMNLNVVLYIQHFSKCVPSQIYMLTIV